MDVNAKPPQTATLTAALSAVPDIYALDLADLEAVRLVLRGNSVIDWNRAVFPDVDHVDRFLRLNCIEPTDPEDQRRLRYVHQEAVTYLEEHLGLRFPDELAHPTDVRQVFLEASQTGGFRRRQILACAILKLMHTVAHLEAAELRHQTPLSEADLLDLAERRIDEAARKMRDEGFPVVAFYGNRKTRNSIITKLLAKREATAATVFDKLRFRVVTEKREHIVPAIAWLCRNVTPFNFVIPGQSHNNLVDLHREWARAPYAHLASQLHGFMEEDTEPFNPEDNPFSGASYRTVNYIVDYPVRIDHLGHARYGALLGKVVMVQIEFQVVDEQTADKNELGENSHELYKERQRAIVASRLRKGGRYKRKRKTRAERNGRQSNASAGHEDSGEE